MLFAARSPRCFSSSACRPCNPGEIANAVSIRTTPVSKSSSGTPFQAACRALLDTHATSFAVIHQNLIQAVRTDVAHDARLRANEVAIVASIAGAAAEAAAGLFHGLLFRIRLNHLMPAFFSESSAAATFAERAGSAGSRSCSCGSDRRSHRPESTAARAPLRATPYPD